jgi:hypothetical protein
MCRVPSTILRMFPIRQEESVLRVRKDDDPTFRSQSEFAERPIRRRDLVDGLSDNFEDGGCSQPLRFHSAVPAS